jgi:hypothetical protein
MERHIVNGVPYFTDNQNRLYTWDTEAQPQIIGAYNPTTDTVTYEPNHLDKLAERLEDWRSKQQPRDRKAIANSRRNPRGKASKPAQDSEGDE